MTDVYRTGCKAAVEKRRKTTSLASRKISPSLRKNGFTVNALGQKVFKTKDQNALRKAPKGAYFGY